MSEHKFEKILKKIYTITIGREISQQLFLRLSEEQTAWVIQAAANVIIADGKIESEEFEVMQDIIQYLENEKQLLQLLDCVRTMKPFELEELQVEPRLGADIYFFLANIAYVGGIMTQDEAELFPKYSKLLQLDTDFCKSIIRWAKKQSELNLRWIQEQGELYAERTELLESAG